MSDRLSKLRRRSEDGFTLIELLVSITILVIGVFGLVSSVDGSRNLTNVAEHEDVAAQVADRELDQAATLPYINLSLNATPVTGGATADDATQWNTYLTSTNLLPQPSGGHNCSTFWTSATAASAGANDETTCLLSCPPTTPPAGCQSTIGGVAPTGSVTVPVGSGSRVRLKIYRYVTWVNDTACGTACPNLSANAYKGDYKRITIAVVPVTRSVTASTGLPPAFSNQGPRRPIVMSAIRVDPTLGTGNQAGSASPCTLQKAIVC